MKRNLWPLGIAGGLLFVVAANIAMVVVAQGSPPILETDDAYQAGLGYEGVLAEARASAALGFRAELAAGGGTFEVALRDSSGAPVAGLQGQARLYRADTRAYDAELPLVEGPPGHYRAPFTGKAGLYRLGVRLSDGQRTWVDDRALMVGP